LLKENNPVRVFQIKNIIKTSYSTASLCEKEFSMNIGVKKSQIILAMFSAVSVIFFIISTLQLVNFSPFNNCFYLSSSIFFAWLYLNPAIAQSKKLNNMPVLLNTKAWYLVPVSFLIGTLGYIFT